MINEKLKIKVCMKPENLNSYNKQNITQSETCTYGLSYPALQFVLFDDFRESLLVTQTCPGCIQAAKLSIKTKTSEIIF